MPGGLLLPRDLYPRLAGSAPGVELVRRFHPPRHEKRVEQHLRLRNVESFLPLYRSPRKWRNGLKVVLELPLFPGYIFVRISARSE